LRRLTVLFYCFTRQKSLKHHDRREQPPRGEP
jgi:hypothetical protein